MALLALAISACNVVMFCLLVRQQSATAGRAICCAGLLVGLVIVAQCSVWIRGSGLASVSPLLANAQLLPSVYECLFGGILLAMFAVATSNRLTSHVDETRPHLNWRHRTTYLHEQRAVLAMLVATMLAHTIFHQMYLYDSHITYRETWLSLLGRVISLRWVGDLVTSAEGQLHFAILLLAAFGLIAKPQADDQGLLTRTRSIHAVVFPLTCVGVARNRSRVDGDDLTGAG